MTNDDPSNTATTSTMSATTSEKALNEYQNGSAKKHNVQPMSAPSSASAAAPAPTAEPELSNAEKKKRKQAEKAAKRALSKEETVGGSTEQVPSKNNVTGSIPSHARKQSTGGKNEPTNRQTEPKGKQPSTSAHNRTGSASGTAASQQMTPRQQAPQGSGATQKSSNKQVAFFSHLYGPPRRHTLEGTPKDVHPAIMALGLQIGNYTICGSQARCIAMLLALKSVIQSYTTPHGASLPHHLPNHGLSPHLSYLKSHRPFSVVQANAIRWLKIIIAQIDPAAPEPTAKADICSAIDTFVHERFTIADKVIADAVNERIENGDVIITFAKSAVVMKTLLQAKEKGKNFRVVVIDSRPRFEGKNLAITLSSAGIDVRYALTTSTSQVMKGATKCILGAHGIMGNGRLFSRLGTSLVAMHAKQHAIPVMVCSESIKFTERVTLDSTGFNEIAPEDETVATTPVGSAKLKDWRDKDGLQILNLLYDATPVEYLDVIITELGSVPPSSAPVVQRMGTGS